MSKFSFKTILILTLVSGLFFSCSNDDESDLIAQVTVNGKVLFDQGDDFNGDVDADFTGNGGSVTRSFEWNNNLRRADYNADITATAEGSFTMVVTDADGTIVLERSLAGNTEPDSFSGVTSAGVSGIWTVTITLTSFNGDGSFSLSEGD